METKSTKEERIKTVNQIIEVIASRGRKFFAYEDRVAFIHQKGKKYFYHCEYKDWDVCLSVPNYMQPKKWCHGGTMLGLVKDFVDYIKTGEKSNHNHGYGGLYCPHWGYPEDDINYLLIKNQQIL